MSKTIRRIAISTGGGDAPGLNAVIRAVVIAASDRDWECYGIRDGYNGILFPERYPDGGVFRLTRERVRGIGHLGGTILGTTNKGNPLCFPMKMPDGSVKEVDRTGEILDCFARKELDALVSIGGDGSLLMGANMQKQAVPLVVPEAPYIGTGVEARAARDAGDVVLAEADGTVVDVSGDQIVVEYKAGAKDRNGNVLGKKTYRLAKFRRSNQNTAINQKVIVEEGQKVSDGDVLADGPATHNGELALGKNLLVAFMPWEGYNYEDAIILSERLVKDDVLTSIHIEEHEVDARDTKLGAEEITRDIPNLSEEILADLDDRGIIRVGAEVAPGDVLVGKVPPKGETEQTPEERLLRAIFGEKAREVRDTSLKVPHGEYGKVIDVRVFSREER